jgi:hypothetical protein
MTMQIKVMHDYQCYPLWVLRDGGDVASDESPEELGLSPALAGRLNAWWHWGESRINMADPHDSRAVSEREVAAFDAEGRLLAKRVGVELPSASVSYVNDEASH